MVVSSKSCKFWPNRWFFVLFHEMSPFLQLFPEKMTKTPKHASFVDELRVLGKSMIFRASERNEPLFATFCMKSWPKRLNMVVFKSKSCKLWQNRWFFVHFLEMSYFLQLFAEKLTKTPKDGCFLEKLQVLAKSMIFRAFSRNELLFATFCWKVHQNAQAW